MTKTEAKIVLTAEDKTRAAFAAVQGGMERLDKTVGSVTGGLGGLASAFGAAFAVAGTVNFINNTIDALDELNDSADATGATIENLSALEDIARKNGGTLGDVTSILVKFNGALNASDGEKSGTAQALKAIGLNAKELKALDPAEALQKTAIALSRYADDGNKARIVQELFGKSIKEAGPYLKDLAEAGTLNATVTKEQAQAAEAFNKQLFALQTNASNIARTVVGDLLPALNKWIETEKAAQEVYGTFSLERSRVVGDALFGREATDQLNKYSAKLREARAEMESLNEFSDPVRLDELRKETAELEKHVEYYSRLAKGDYGNEGRGSPGPGKPSLGGGGTGGKAKPQRAEFVGPEIPPEYLAAIERLGSIDTGKIAKLREELNRLLAIRQAEGGGRVDEAILDVEEELARLDPAARQAAEAQRQLNEALAQTPTGRLEKAREEVDRLTELLKNAADPKTTKKLQEAIDGIYEGIGAIPDIAAPAFDEFAAQAQSAAQKIQDTLGATTEAILGGHFEDIGKMWERLLIKLTADAIQADLTKALFGEGGFGTTMANFFAGLSSSSSGPGTRAAGGPVNAGTLYQVNERGKEWFKPAVGGQIIPLGTGQAPAGVQIVNNVPAGVTRAELQQALQLSMQATEASILTKLRRVRAI